MSFRIKSSHPMVSPNAAPLPAPATKSGEEKAPPPVVRAPLPGKKRSSQNGISMKTVVTSQSDYY